MPYDGNGVYHYDREEQAEFLGGIKKKGLEIPEEHFNDWAREIDDNEEYNRIYDNDPTRNAEIVSNMALERVRSRKAASPTEDYISWISRHDRKSKSSVREWARKALSEE